MSGEDHSVHITPVANPNNPSFAEMAAALKALNTPADIGLGKHIATIIVAAALGLGLYVVTGVADMKSSMGKIQVTVDQSKTTLDNLQKDIKAVTEAQSDLKVQQASINQRVDVLERAQGIK